MEARIMPNIPLNARYFLLRKNGHKIVDLGVMTQEEAFDELFRERNNNGEIYRIYEIGVDGAANFIREAENFGRGDCARDLVKAVRIQYCGPYGPLIRF